MRAVKAIALVCALCVAPFAAFAQSDEGTRLERLIERTLSDEGRIIDVTGFRGALSTRAQFDRLTIADDEGIWLTMDDAVLDWDLSALLRGTLNIGELSAASIEIARKPVPPAIDLPAAEASGFSFPELPVAVRIGSLSVPVISLGAPLLGEAMTMTLQASARLDDAGMDVNMTANRTDGSQGAFTLETTFDPVSTQLSVQADLSEDRDGLLSRALDIPGTPSLRLTVSGAGPLDDFVADMVLATEGETRLSGQVTLRAKDAGGRAFQARLGGDVRPLLRPQTHEFFGADIRLDAEGLQRENGAFDLETVSLTSKQMQLTGQGALSADGTLSRVALSGTLAGEDRVALPGTEVSLKSAKLQFDFDATTGPDWTVNVDAVDVRTPVADLERAQMSGTGQLTPQADTVLRGTLSLDASGFAPHDPALAQAAGPNIAIATDVTANAGGQISLTGLTLAAQHITLTGTAQTVPADKQVGLSLQLNVSAPDLAPFSALAAPLQGGTLEAQLTANALFPGGTFTAELTGSGKSFDIGQPQLTPLLDPQTDLELFLRRDASGTGLDRFSLKNPLLDVDGSGRISSEAAEFGLVATLTDISRIVPELSGPVTVKVEGEGQPDTGAFTARFRTNAQFIQAAGSANMRADQDIVTFDATLDAPEFGFFGALIAPVKGGALKGIVTGQFDTRDQSVRADITGVTTDVDIGQPRLAPLLRPETTTTARILRSGDGIFLESLTLQNPQLDATGSGALTEAGVQLDLTARLANLSVLEPKLSGPVTLDLSATGTPGFKALTARFDAATGFAKLTGQAQLNGVDGGQRLKVTADLDATDLAALSRLAPPLRAGAAQAGFTVDADFATSEITVTLDGTTRNLDLGVTALAPILSPQTRWQATARQTPEGTFLDQLILSGPALSADGTAVLTDARAEAGLTARLSNLGPIVPALPGAVTLTASATNVLNQPQITARIEGANGIVTDISGRVGLAGGAVDLNATGRAPLGLAQPFLADRVLSGQTDFRLGLTGQPALSSLSGTVDIQNGRLSDPGLGLVLAPITGSIRLDAGTATLSLQSQANGGTLRADGRMSLLAPFATDASLQIGSVPLRYRDVFRTTLSGQIQLQGPAARRLAISGAIQLSDTEIRVPDTGLGTIDPVPLIRHVGAPRDVRRTLERADLPDSTNGNGSASGPGLRLPLSLTVTSNDPVFVRGRGLDAEFQGRLRIEGSASNPVPIGQFTLRRGRLSFLGKRLELTEGSVTAAGSLIPRLRIVAEASTPDVTARIALEGPADKPELSLSSVPNLPEDEILALLLFGKSAASLSPFQIARLISSLSQLSGRGGSGFLETTRARLGFDDLDVRTNADTGELELAIGKYVTENIYSEVELGAQGEAQLNLNLDISDNTRVRGSVSSEGETGIGLFWQKDY